MLSFYFSQTNFFHREKNSQVRVRTSLLALWRSYQHQAGTLEGGRLMREGAPRDQSSRRCFPDTVARELVKSASRNFHQATRNVLPCPKEVLNELEGTSHGWNPFESSSTSGGSSLFISSG